MADPKDDHLSDADMKDYHQPSGGASEKGCFWRHISPFDRGNQCSHRWHARLQAEGDPQLYDYPKYKDLCVDHRPGRDDHYPTAAYRGGKAARPSNNYAMRHAFPNRKRPRPGQWNVGLGQNFSEDATRPYWHNAHHIIPVSIIEDEIARAGEADIRVSRLIKIGLLKAQYNHNDKPNMVILPHDRVVAAALGLPRHLKGHESAAHEFNPTARRETDHPDYSRRVKFKIRPVIDQYKATVSKGANHPAPPDALAKDALVNVSKEIYAAIKAAGPHMKGKSLDELRFSSLGGR